ncbi:hypothetical protein AcW1_001691 [Taiwanofungus camphoratus]|nr:hypothetical protein AcV7_001549 [Antrodia cinnamomea]KAI0945476.1 hypothetical protein AcW1_001691 [Antrodia cinnamomea]
MPPRVVPAIKGSTGDDMSLTVSMRWLYIAGAQKQHRRQVCEIKKGEFCGRDSGDHETMDPNYEVYSLQFKQRQLLSPDSCPVLLCDSYIWLRIWIDLTFTTRRPNHLLGGAIG